MAPTKHSDAEIKLTAALYAQRRGVVDHIRDTGRLPDEIPTGGMVIAMQKLINRRGCDTTLTPDEQLVYDAILREGRLPGGGVHLINQPKSDQDG